MNPGFSDFHSVHHTYLSNNIPSLNLQQISPIRSLWAAEGSKGACNSVPWQSKLRHDV